nr:dirigent protein 6 [Phryma leptostachya subsp. asiatica]
MAKLIVLVLMVSSLLAAISGRKQIAEAEKLWFQNICRGTEKVAKLHFYVQDVLGGSSPTVYEVASANITSNSPTTFGQVRVLDDLLTAEPDRSSEEVGRVQGLITFSDLETSALAMNLNFYFTSTEFKGSTISILGRNQLMNTERELAVVGGTGVFRFARGYAITSTYSYDVNTSYGVLEYTLYVTYNNDSNLRLKANM